jgi:hypothetical protein
MPEFTKILTDMESEHFVDIFGGSSRKARESYFQRHGIKKPKKKLGLNRPGVAQLERINSLHTILSSDQDEEMAEEILRTWLLSKREMLVTALDFLDIAHREGLTESEDIEKFEKLNTNELKALIAALSEFPAEQVRVYLQFMGTKNLDKVLS